MTTSNHNLNRMKRHFLLATLVLSAMTVLSSLSFAHNTSAGCNTSNAVTISDENNWKTLCSVKLDLTDGTHDCVATGTAMVANTVGDIHNEYRFNLATQKSPATDLDGEMVIDVSQDPSGTDLKVESISAVHHFNVKAGTKTFYWLARPFDSDADKIDVTKYSMGVVCTDGN